MADENKQEVIFLNPHTCGIYRKGSPLYKIDPTTGRRTEEIDNELGEYVDRFLDGETFDGYIKVPTSRIFERQILVPRYYDSKWIVDFQDLIQSLDVTSISLGELKDEGIVSVTGGHGSPGTDKRGTGKIPYIKVSDLRALRVNVNPTNLVSRKVAERFWRGKTSGLKAWDLITPNRASNNIGEFVILLPGEEDVVITKEVFVLRVELDETTGWDPFYLLWALCLKSVREQWRRVALMQTNREDVGNRYREILIPKPKSKDWAEQVSGAFRVFFTTLAEASGIFIDAVKRSEYEFIASVASLTVGGEKGVE